MTIHHRRGRQAEDVRNGRRAGQPQPPSHSDCCNPKQIAGSHAARIHADTVDRTSGPRLAFQPELSQNTMPMPARSECRTQGAIRERTRMPADQECQPRRAPGARRPERGPAPWLAAVPW
jgi:hypothetical protein